MMPTRTPRAAAALALALIVAAAACKRETPPPSSRGDSSADASARAIPPSVGTSTSAPAEAPFPFTDAELDTYEKCMRKEIELVKAAKAQGDSAKTPAERGAASQAAFESSTVPAAAQAIGASVDRYQATRRTVNRVFETLDFQGMIAGPMEIDTARASPEMKRRLSGDPFVELEPASATALRARLDPLSRVWIEYTNLVVVSR